MIETIITELRRAIEKLTGCRKPKPERRFHKHDEFLSYSLKAPDFHRLMKEFTPRFLGLGLSDRLNLAAKLLNKHVGEMGHAGIFILILSVEQLRPRHFRRLDVMVEDFRSWSHVDYFGIEVMGPLLLRYRDETLALLEGWNCSPNRFKRRASVVVFTRDVAKSARFTEDAIRLCDNLIWDNEDIVRKGVGWALKDNMRSSPEQILVYVKNLRRRGVSSTITLYAIRDLNPAQRKEVLAIKRE
ncbi:MAG: DNA alkylation repair protein [Sedimentisphaerales bacterium]|nr:DNA alkylation repair protein [Sedimentisphaerales bacterium]